MPDAETNNQAPPAWVSAAQDEWRLHRGSISDAEGAAQQTLTFGGATVGVLIAGGITGWKQVVPSTLIFLVVIPLVIAAVGAQWAGQKMSVQRDGRYVRDLEAAIRAAYGSQGEIPAAFFVWQKLEAEGLAKSGIRPDRRWLAAAATAAFLLLADWSLAIGIYRGWHWHPWLVACVAAVEWVALTAALVWLTVKLNATEKGNEAHQAAMASISGATEK